MTLVAEGHSLVELIRRARLRLLDLHYYSKSGHLGGNFSCIDSLIALYHAVMDKDDLFVLSKGHSVGALYVTLASCGILDEESLQTYGAEGTRLSLHPPSNTFHFIPFGTGSLGHGPSLAAGLALGKRLQQLSGRVFCLCSDGELQEGSCWEALIFAVHQRLANLTILVDVNGWQGFGSTIDVASMAFEGIRDRFVAFGAHVVCCDGHVPADLVDSLTRPGPDDAPTVCLLRTIKGKGLPVFENTMESHYVPLDEDQYVQCRRALECPP